MGRGNSEASAKWRPVTLLIWPLSNSWRLISYMSAEYSASACAEFPNDNPDLHRGAIWRCVELGAAASPDAHEPRVLVTAALEALLYPAAHAERADREVLAGPRRSWPTQRPWRTQPVPGRRRKGHTGSPGGRAASWCTPTIQSSNRLSKLRKTRRGSTSWTRLRLRKPWRSRRPLWPSLTLLTLRTLQLPRRTLQPPRGPSRRCSRQTSRSSRSRPSGHQELARLTPGPCPLWPPSIRAPTPLATSSRPVRPWTAQSATTKNQATKGATKGATTRCSATKTRATSRSSTSSSSRGDIEGVAFGA